MTVLQKSKSIAKWIGNEAIDRVDPRTTGSKWKKVRNWVGIGSSVLLLLVSPICPFALPAGIASWITFVGSAGVIVAGGAHLDKSGKK